MKKAIATDTLLIFLASPIYALELVDYKGLYKPNNGREFYTPVHIDCAVGKVHATLIGDNKINVSYVSTTSIFNVRGKREGNKVWVDKVKDIRGVESSFEGTINGETITGTGWQSVSINHKWYPVFRDKKVCKGSFTLHQVEIIR